jgi:hypothetical protein
MTGGGLSHVDWGRSKAVGGTTRSILSKNYNDAQYRKLFLDLVKKYRIRVIFEHRISTVQKDSSAIRSITLDHAPPDALGCPAATAAKSNANLANALGFERGIFDDTQGWPHQLYVREARRMQSDYVLKQKDLDGTTNPGDSIGLAS